MKKPILKKIICHKTKVTKAYFYAHNTLKTIEKWHSYGHKYLSVTTDGNIVF